MLETKFTDIKVEISRAIKSLGFGVYVDGSFSEKHKPEKFCLVNFLDLPKKKGREYRKKICEKTYIVSERYFNFSLKVYAKRYEIEDQTIYIYDHLPDLKSLYSFGLHVVSKDMDLINNSYNGVNEVFGVVDFEMNYTNYRSIYEVEEMAEIIINRVENGNDKTIY